MVVMGTVGGMAEETDTGVETAAAIAVPEIMGMVGRAVVAVATKVEASTEVAADAVAVTPAEAAIPVRSKVGKVVVVIMHRTMTAMAGTVRRVVAVLSPSASLRGSWQT
jgi:hypothetical protein